MNRENLPGVLSIPSGVELSAPVGPWCGALQTRVWSWSSALERQENGEKWVAGVRGLELKTHRSR